MEFFTTVKVMVFPWSWSDTKCPQISRALLSILAVLNNAFVLIVSTRPPTSKSSRLFNNPSVTLSKHQLLYFDLRPSPKMLFQGDTPEGSDTFQWPVIERDRVGLWYGTRWRSHCATTVMHRKRVTSELHDSYFRLITIKHPISKIQWAIVWALNYYLTQLSSGCQSSCQQTSRELETICGKESHTRPMGIEALINWGPEKMLIRCSKESQHPAVDPKTSGWASKRTRKTQRDGHK